MSDIMSDSEIILTLPILLTLCNETRKRMTRILTQLPPPPSTCSSQNSTVFPPELLGREQFLLYRIKRKVRPSISYQNRRSDPDCGAQITKFKPPEQFDFWSNILYLNQPMFNQKIYQFNNIIHADGFTIAVESVRRDLQGQKCKPDNKASISDLYIDDVDVDTFQDKRIVVCDPGKRDLLYVGSKITDQQLAMVHETEQQRNIRLMNQNKKYKWLGMTQMFWSLKSRINEKQKQWAKKYTGVDYDMNQMIESNEITIVDANTKLSAFAANSTSFIDFSNFVVAKLQQVFLTIDF
ncbi:hypothetical protein P9112_006507 [Eukaryota sp. TZLM1-RC]